MCVCCGSGVGKCAKMYLWKFESFMESFLSFHKLRVLGLGALTITYRIISPILRILTTWAFKKELGM